MHKQDSPTSILEQMLQFMAKASLFYPVKLILTFSELENLSVINPIPPHGFV